MRIVSLWLALFVSLSAGAGEDLIRLNERCPPSFDLVAGRCRLATLYQLYTAAPGQGGLRAPTPPLRETFTPAQIDLGRYLFFDPILSADGTLSCAHCHHPDFGFADGRPTSMGRRGRGVGPERVGGAILARGAPTLWNVGFLQRFFWDARANSLEQQLLQGPLYASDELANSRVALENSLSANATYRRLFHEAFPASHSDAIPVAEVAVALAAFETSLISLNSPYDRYAHGDEHALTREQLRGYAVFRGFVARCSQCHVPPLFTSGELAVVGAPPVPGRRYDPGAGALRDDEALRGAFKIPTLRNIDRTGPYFQAGQFRTLTDVVEFYNDTRGHAVPAGESIKVHWHIWMDRPRLSDADVADLVSFLHALTDESLRPEIPRRVPSGLSVVEVRTATSEALP